MVKCSRCGNENPEGYNFCSACAAPLTVGETPTTMPAQQPTLAPVPTSQPTPQQPYQPPAPGIDMSEWKRLEKARRKEQKRMEKQWRREEKMRMRMAQQSGYPPVQQPSTTPTPTPMPTQPPQPIASPVPTPTPAQPLQTSTTPTSTVATPTAPPAYQPPSKKEEASSEQILKIQGLIQKLDDLRKENILTTEEYQTKRVELEKRLKKGSIS